MNIFENQQPLEFDFDKNQEKEIISPYDFKKNNEDW